MIGFLAFWEGIFGAPLFWETLNFPQLQRTKTTHPEGLPTMLVTKKLVGPSVMGPGPSPSADSEAYAK